MNCSTEPWNDTIPLNLVEALKTITDKVACIIIKSTRRGGKQPVTGFCPCVFLRYRNLEIPKKMFHPKWITSDGITWKADGLSTSEPCIVELSQKRWAIFRE